jgi:hypothetical protein
MWVEVRADERSPAPLPLPARDAWSGNGIEVEAPPTPTSEARAHRASPLATSDEAVSAPKRPGPRRAKATATATAKPAVVTPEDAPSTDATSAGSGPAETTPPAAFGAAGLPPGVRHLPRAFARAVALANRGDAAWRTLPPGVVGEASVALPVEVNGALGTLAFDDAKERDRLLPAVRRMLDNTVLLLSSGRFSLNARELSGGVMRVRVRVEILEQSALADHDVDPNELNAIDYEPPQAGKPGHGAFLLNSGRRVICWVTPLG